MSTGVNVDHAFARCRTLLDALLTVSSLGLRSGLISISSQNLHGWVAFEGKHIVKAVVVETAQIGRGALRALSAIPNATYSYKAPEAEPAYVADEVDDSKFAVAHDQTTMFFGEQVVVFRNPVQGVTNDGLQEHLHRTMTDAEFRKGVLGENVDPNDEFMKKDSWLSAPEPPLKDFVQHRQEELAASIPLEQEFSLFAKAGYAIDFRDPTAVNNRRASGFGAAGALPEEKTESKKRRLSQLKLIAPLALIFGLLLGGLKCAMDGTLIAPDTAPVETPTNNGQAPFKLPAGETSSTPPSVTTPMTAAGVKGSAAAGTASTEKSGTKAPRIPEPLDAKEFALANDRSTLFQLDQLVRSYMLKKNYKHARDLAGAGFRSPYATPEEKQRFYLLYQESVNMIKGQLTNAK
ncbi:MAG TPA: hypothetical protein V6D22_10185 [Candidatus Obscuribacterales bacterium]